MRSFIELYRQNEKLLQKGTSLAFHVDGILELSRGSENWSQTKFEGTKVYQVFHKK